MKQTAPFFVKELQPQPLTIGGTVTLECMVTGWPEPEIEWFKNDQPIPMSNRLYISFKKFNTAIKRWSRNLCYF